MTTPTTVQVRLQIRADTAANWASVNPVLLANELGLESDTKKFKLGDGATAWGSLAYFPSIVSGGTVLGNLEIGTTGTLTFEGSTADGFETTLGVVDPTADRTILLPNQSGTVVVGGNASITNADIAANAEIAVSKLANGTANQVLVTDGTDVSWSDNLTLAGDLTVNGTTTTINTQDLLVEDKNIIIGNVDTPSDATADGGGITLKGATDKTINWLDSTDAWTSSERFSVPLGSASAPSLTFTSDENTGIYSPGADQVAVATNGTGRLVIDSSGNIEIAGTGKRIRGDFSNATDANRLSFQTSTTDSATSIFAIPNGAGSVASYVVTNASDPTNCSFGQLVVNSNLEVDLLSSALGSGTALPLRIRTAGATHISALTNNTERARIDSSGRLLVGTSSSANVGGAGSLQQIFSNSQSELLSLTCGNNNAGACGRIVLGHSRSTTYGSYAILSNNDLVGSILFAGDDGTDLNTPAAQIDCLVDGTPGANDMPGRLVFSTTADGASSPTERMRIASNGDFGFNTSIIAGEGGISIIDGEAGARQIYWKRVSTTSTSYPLSFNNGSTNVGSVSFTNTATSYSTSSDYRLKENVVAVTDGITRLQQLKPSRFNFIADPSKTVDGFLAHEVQAVVPEAITGEKDAVDDDGNPVYQGIDQSKLVPLLTAALQEAIGRIETLEAEVAALKAQ